MKAFALAAVILAAAPSLAADAPMVTLRMTQQQLLLIVQGLQGLPYRQAAPLLKIIDEAMEKTDGR
jgi:hypothetical protein